jgi:hypothetical protein
MPTGYTSGIIDGKTKTFEEYAKQCMRAFGATIHMRDDSLNSEYEPRTPSSYYTDRIFELQKELDDLKNTSDEKLLENIKSKYAEQKEYLAKRVLEKEKTRTLLYKFLNTAINYNPPTEEHVGIKKFMIEQLEMTISSDCDTDYELTELQKLKSLANNVDVAQIREELTSSINESLEYYQKEFNKELKRCTDSNLWVEHFLQSLEGAENIVETI